MTRASVHHGIFRHTMAQEAPRCINGFLAPSTHETRPRCPARRRPHPRRLPRRRTHLVQLVPLDPGGHHPLVPHPGLPRQHRLDPRLAPGRPRASSAAPLPGPRQAPPWPSSAPSSATWSAPDPQPEAIGRWAAIAPSWSTARRSPCPTPRRCRPTSASPATKPKGAASRWPTCWRCSMPARGCCWRSTQRANAAADLAGLAGVLGWLTAGDVLVADRGFCSFAGLGAGDDPGMPLRSFACTRSRS